MRNLLPETEAALEAGSAIIYSLVEIRTPTPILATNAHREIQYANETFKVDAGLGKLPTVTQEFSLSAGTMTLPFSDSDNAYLAMSQNPNIYNSQLDIHFVVLSLDDDSVLEVIPSVARGYLNDIKPGHYKIDFEFKNHMHKFSKTAGRRTNSPSQNRFYPDDKGFDILTDSVGATEL